MSKSSIDKYQNNKSYPGIVERPLHGEKLHRCLFSLDSRRIISSFTGTLY